jgi:hypothetical protein
LGLMLPLNRTESLQRHLVRIKAQHEQDLEDGFGRVHLPFTIGRKFPKAARDWTWQYVFPSSRLSIDPRSGKRQRHHIAEGILQSALKAGGGCGRNRQTRQLPQPAAFLCHASAHARLRHSHGAGVVRPQGRKHDDDLHTRAEQAGCRREKSLGLRRPSGLTPIDRRASSVCDCRSSIRGVRSPRIGG